jgi:hypothetical protein
LTVNIGGVLQPLELDQNYPPQRPCGYLGRETPEFVQKRTRIQDNLNPDVARTSADAAGRASVLARTLQWR